MMCDEESNVRFTWQLVSQFVSWEFCRYMCQQNENDSSEVDVLTFLRNMIVERTEKSISEITKQEIVAKLIMEAKSVQSLSRLSCVLPISESVKKMCPELEPAVCKLIHHLENFLNILDYNEDSQKQALIKVRIEDAINEFSCEASKFLPFPDILKVVQLYNHQNKIVPKKPKKKTFYSSALFEKVLECLHFESITPSEARNIALSLGEDSLFEKVMANAETEADSETFSFSTQSSQAPGFQYSQDFDKTTPQFIAAAALHDEDSPVLILPSPTYPRSERDIPEKPPTLVPERKISTPCHSMSNINATENEDPFVDLPMSEDEPIAHEKSFFYRKKPVVLSDSESDKEQNSLMTMVNNRLNQFSRAEVLDDSGSDTSDCDKNAEYRFLTPTLYKERNEGNAQKVAKAKNVVYLSDSESNDSSIITNPPGSQQNDPNWSVGRSPAYHSPVVFCGRPVKKRCMASKPVKLFNERNQGIQEFILKMKKPTVDPAISKDVPVHRATNTRPQKNAVPFRKKTADGKQKCKFCSRSYKTTVGLRRHVFLCHPTGNSDSD